MAREYARQKFLRLAGRDALEEYIAKNGWKISMPQNLKKKDFGVEADAIFETLPAGELKKADAEFRAINELATSSGVTDMIEHGRRLNVDIMSTFEPLKTNQEKAFRCFLDERYGPDPKIRTSSLYLTHVTYKAYEEAAHCS